MIAILAKNNEGSTALITERGVFGQLTTALVIDNFGWFDSKTQPMNAWKVVGAILLLIGALMMGKK